MSHTQSEILAAVVAEGSYIRAAGQLGLTPSAVSHSISAMEEEYGFPILVRSKYGVRLTSAGESIYPMVQAVLNAEKALQTAVENVKGVERGRVKLAVFASVAVNWIPDIIRSFQKQYPKIEFEIFEGSYDDVVGWVNRGVADFGFMSASSPRGDLKFKSLTLDPMMCVAPRGFQTKTPGQITAEELSQQPIVFQQKGTDADAQMVMNKYKLTMQTPCHVNDDFSTVSMVNAGFGLGIMPELTIRRLTRDVDVLAIYPPQYREIGLVYTNEKILTPAARKLMEHITQMFADEKKK